MRWAWVKTPHCWQAWRPSSAMSSRSRWVFAVARAWRPQAGVMLAAEPMVGLIALGIWLAVALLTRYSSLAALVAACSAPISGLLYTQSAVVCGALAAMSGLLIWRHADNIRRLMNGTESRIGGKKAQNAG